MQALAIEGSGEAADAILTLLNSLERGKVPRCARGAGAGVGVSAVWHGRYYGEHGDVGPEAAVASTKAWHASQHVALVMHATALCSFRGSGRATTTCEQTTGPCHSWSTGGMSFAALIRLAFVQNAQLQVLV